MYYLDITIPKTKAELKFSIIRVCFVFFIATNMKHGFCSFQNFNSTLRSLPAQILFGPIWRPNSNQTRSCELNQIPAKFVKRRRHQQQEIMAHTPQMFIVSLLIRVLTIDYLRDIVKISKFSNHHH